MLNINKLIIFIVASLSLNAVFACDRPLTIREFKVNKNIKVQVPARPNFYVKSVKRGQRIRDSSSCYFLATLGVISLKARTIPNIPQGYLFEIVQGKLENNKIFPTYPVFLKYPGKERGQFNFEWSDGDSKIQEPFNIMVKITGVSRSGMKSKPQYLQIKHKGVRVPWWNIWKKLPSTMTQVFEPDLFSQSAVGQ